MPASRMVRSARPWVTRKKTAIALTVLLAAGSAIASLAMTPEAGTGDASPAPGHGPLSLHVDDLAGAASAMRGAVRRPLLPGALVAPGEVLQVGPAGAMRLSDRAGTRLELGVDAVLVTEEPSPDAAAPDTPRLRLGLKRGYLRIESAAAQGTAVDLSVGAWSARIGAGEYFFESSSQGVVGCTPAGSIQWSGIRGSTPPTTTDGCVQLRPDQAPTTLALRREDLEAARRDRQLASRVRSPAVPHERHAANPTDPSAPARPGLILTTTLSPFPSLEPIRAPLWFDGPTAAPRQDAEAAADALLERQPPAAGGLPSAPTPAFVPALKWAASLGERFTRPRPATPQTPRLPPARPSAPTPPSPWPGVSRPSTNAPSIAGRRPSVPGPAREWAVNVSSHQTLELAERQADELRAHGFAASVRSELRRGVPSFRVVVPGHASEAEANDTLSRLHSELGIRSAWVLRRR